MAVRVVRTGGAGGGGVVSSTPREEALSSPAPSSPGLWELMHQAGPAVWSPDLPEEYHGPHPADRRTRWERIEWIPVVRPAGRVRVLSHTCGCLPTVYELCGLGGAYFIRRTTCGPSATVVHDSAHVPAAQAGDLWFRLLRGRAR